jgi:hypothetical protein
MTSKRCSEKTHLKKHLASIKYDKLSMDRCLNIVPSQITLSNKNYPKKPAANQQLNSSNSSHSLRISVTQDEPEATPQTQRPQNQFHIQQQKLQNRLSTPLELCNATHFANLKDTQTFILRRLDTDAILKKKFNKSDAVELINLLLIKANFCILYVERILDFILSDFISSTEIKSIPVTLSGFYLYLIQRILHHHSDACALGAKTKKEILYAIFGLCVLESRVKMSAYLNEI